MEGLRSTHQRRDDVEARLGSHPDAWLATADRSGRAHLIVVATAWDGTDLVIATRDGSPTARNLGASGQARLAFGSADDVVMLDTVVEETLPARAGGGPIPDRFIAAVGWDPADEGDDWRYFRLRPTRIQAYRGYGEQRGRDVMRDGAWLA